MPLPAASRSLLATSCPHPCSPPCTSYVPIGQGLTFDADLDLAPGRRILPVPIPQPLATSALR